MNGHRALLENVNNVVVFRCPFGEERGGGGGGDWGGGGGFSLQQPTLNDKKY